MEETISEKSNKILISAILISISLVYGSFIITQSLVDLRKVECEKIEIEFFDLYINSDDVYKPVIATQIDSSVEGICEFDTEE